MDILGKIFKRADEEAQKQGAVQESPQNGGEDALTKAEQEQIMSNLPILEYAQEIKELIKNNETSIIIGETGSGKTTQIPLLLRDILSPDAKVAITQPRKVAARSVSKYVAGQVGCEIGQEVGYQVRFDDHTSEGTRINFMTDGILLRQIQQDPLLKDYAAVMVDEAHERSLNIDFILGLLKRTQRLRKQHDLEPLKIIVTSATLEKEKFLNFFDQAPAVEVPGRSFKIDISYEEKTPYDVAKAAADKVLQITKQGIEGDILIFMPGQLEINNTIKAIDELHIPGIMTLPLHGELSPEDQDRIFKPSKTRKVIVSTNIAETSVTVPSVRIVIDSGLIKQTEFNPESGIQSLYETEHAQSGCTQRAGRAGRVAPGECYRLYTEDDFKEREQFQKPEILRSNLAHVVLMMKSIGIDNIKQFEFIDPPAQGVLDKALESLQSLGALDDEEKMTPIGETMAELPLEPRIARMVIEAQKYNCVETVCTIASFLGLRDVFYTPKTKDTGDDEQNALLKEKRMEADLIHRSFRNSSSDFLTYLNVWKAYEANNGNTDRAYNWAQKNFLNFKVLQEVKEIRYQLFRALSRNGIRATENQDETAIGKCIASGLIDNLMQSYASFSSPLLPRDKSLKFSYVRIKDLSMGYYIHPGSGTFQSNYPFIVPADIRQTTKVYARSIQAVKPEWIKDIAPHLVREKVGELRFDYYSGRANRTIEYFFKGQSESYHVEHQQAKGIEATMMLAAHLAKGEGDLDFIKKNAKVLEMIKSLADRSGGKIATLTTDDLSRIYLRRLGDISSMEELEDALIEDRVNMDLNLDDFIDKETREKIFGDNPESIKLNDHDYKIQYALSGMGATKLMMVSVKIPAKELFDIKNIPPLKSGRSLLVEVTDERGFVIASWPANELAELKKKVGRYFNKALWDEKKPADKFIGSLEDFTDKLLPKLPGPESIGVDPLTSEALVAYPAYTISGFYSFMKEVKLKYYMEKEEAEKVQHLTEVEIAKMRAEERGRKSGLDSLLSGEAFKPKPKVPEKQVKANVLKAFADAKKAKFGK